MANNLWACLRVSCVVVLASVDLSLTGGASAQTAVQRPHDNVTLAQRMTPDPNCSCRANGTFYNEGEQTCIRTSNGRRLALCNKVLNVLNWEMSSNPCPET